MEETVRHCTAHVWPIVSGPSPNSTCIAFFSFFVMIWCASSLQDFYFREDTSSCQVTRRESITSNDWVNIRRRRQKASARTRGKEGKWRRRASYLLRLSARARASLCARDPGRQSRGGDRPPVAAVPSHAVSALTSHIWVRPGFRQKPWKWRAIRPGGRAQFCALYFVSAG